MSEKYFVYTDNSDGERPVALRYSFQEKQKALTIGGNKSQLTEITQIVDCFGGKVGPSRGKGKKSEWKELWVAPNKIQYRKSIEFEDFQKGIKSVQEKFTVVKVRSLERIMR
jgi:hypothetical protein